MPSHVSRAKVRTFFFFFFLLLLLVPNDQTPPFSRYEYQWADGTNIKKPIKVSAPEYVEYLMSWVQQQLDDENIFPSKIGILHFSYFSCCGVL